MPRTTTTRSRPRSPRRSVLRWAAPALLVALLALPACKRSPKADDAGPAALSRPDGPLNVVLVTLDTLRADHLGCYGAPDNPTPRLDALAADGVRFTQAVTTVPHTLAAHCSILTGLYPPHHGVHDNGTFRLPDSRVTLAEHLRQAGYATAAFVSAFVLDRRYGTAQGFDTYDDSMGSPAQALDHAGAAWRSTPQRRGDATIESADAWLAAHRASGGKPFFLWVHLFDPHAPYDPPEPFSQQFRGNPYAGEVAFTDAQVGRLVDRLQTLELLDRSLVIVAGDHGESLGEHGEDTHGLFIYEATMHVPFILRAPQIFAGGRVVDDRVVCLVDIVPTVLDVLGLPAVESDGQSLLRPPTDTARTVYLETRAPQLRHGWSPLFGLRTLGEKYIQAPTPEFYDLRQDPREQNNLADAPAAGRLQEYLTGLRDEFARAEAESAPVTPDAEALRKLAALGYVSGAPTTQASGKDPKEALAAWRQASAHLAAALDAGQFDEAVRLAQAMVAASPENGEAWGMLATAQAELSQWSDALASAERATALQPTEIKHLLVRARALYGLGDAAGFHAALDAARTLEPKHGEIRLLLAAEALHAGKTDEAQALCAEAREVDPVRFSGPAWSLTGQIAVATGQTAAALDAFNKALGIDPHDPPALAGRANLALQQGRFDDAVRDWRALIELRPQLMDVRVNLGLTLARAGRTEEAIAAFEEILAIDAGHTAALQNLGALRARLGALPEAAELLRRALAADPTLTDASLNLARALIKQKKYAEARDVYRAAQDHAPNHIVLLGEHAWLLATAQDDAVRDGARAAELAEHAQQLAGKPVLRVGDALAAAYAELGRFAEAIEVATNVVEVARAVGQEKFAKAVEARMQLYREGKPYRE